MGLTGIQIFKLMPKTNCGECGVPTCLAFAMNLASGKAELDKCPYVSAEAKEKLAAESAPPIRPVTVGTGEYAVKVGGETVLFRHEKTFVNPPGLAVMVSTAEEGASVDGKIDRFKKAQYDRVGLKLRAEMIAVKDAGGDADAFCALAAKAAATGAAMIFMSDSADVLTAAADKFKDKKPLLYAATAANVEATRWMPAWRGMPMPISRMPGGKSSVSGGCSVTSSSWTRSRPGEPLSPGENRTDAFPALVSAIVICLMTVLPLAVPPRGPPTPVTTMGRPRARGSRTLFLEQQASARRRRQGIRRSSRARATASVRLAAPNLPST